MLQQRITADTTGDQGRNQERDSPDGKVQKKAKETLYYKDGQEPVLKQRRPKKSGPQKHQKGFEKEGSVKDRKKSQLVGQSE